MSVAQPDVDARIRAVRELTVLFRAERFVYIGIIVVCTTILLASIGFALFRNALGPVEISTMFGSGGAISVMTGRLIHMWNRAMSLLDTEKPRSEHTG